MLTRLSVVISTRNRSSFLSLCLQSLVNQSNPPDEVVVVDNDSNDDTKEVALGFATKVPLVYFNEKRKGIPYVRNTGLRLAKYQLLAFIDDDCVTQKDWVIQIRTHAPSSTTVIQGSFINAEPESILSEVSYFLNLRHLEAQLLENPNIISFLDTKNFIINRDLLKKLKYFFDEKYLLGGDIELANRLRVANIKVRYVPSITVNHYYQTTLRDLYRRLYWARRTLSRVGLPRAQSDLDKVRTLFGDEGIGQIGVYQEQQLKLLQRAESKLFATFLRKKPLSYRILFHLLVTASKMYIGR